MNAYLDVLKSYILSIYSNSATSLEMQEKIFQALQELVAKLDHLNDMIGSLPIKID